MPGIWWLGPLVVLATADQAPRTGVAEDLDPALVVLDELEQPPSMAEVTDLAGDDRPRNVRRRVTGSLGARWQRAATAADGHEWRAAGVGPGWALRARLRHTAGEARLAAATAVLQGGKFSGVLGGWTWRQGFGLLAGGAGRSSAVAADGSLGPGTAGARGWTGWPDVRSGRGAALAARPGGWSLEAAGGRVGAGAAWRCLAAVGRSRGSWRIAMVRDREGGMSIGACGRWQTGPWSGAWELAAPGRAAATGAAVAAHVAWQHRRALRTEVLLVAAPQGPAAVTAASQPLIGTAAGVVWALRASVRPAPRARVGVLVAGAQRDATAREGPRRRSLVDVIAQAGFTGDTRLEARLRVLAGSETIWSEDWPWAPPVRVPTRRTESVTVALAGRGAASRWQVRVRSYAVAHSATVGRRTLVALTLRDPGDTAWRWQLAWRQAWGAPVDVADAISPLPALLVARHWGQRSGGWFGAAGYRWRCFALDAAVDLRERTGGAREWEAWTAVEIRW